MSAVLHTKSSLYKENKHGIENLAILLLNMQEYPMYYATDTYI
jgi:hypothetical protein